ncbi:extracellular solute-binding protein [Primorskyibacter flagellatus]|uniref:Microcin C transport system substrate-binding protein n=1 Tax=Primorskyibacter flagellatus TaxID=1387277 RepID=A0A1W1ZNP4_9RHOB|nr:extracellular solute-binding protein [Primorskyibacter flagellatus]SMC49994.1 microcin C transport system substrate-binding protein [Primorskyibacter flagellatus]
MIRTTAQAQSRISKGMSVQHAIAAGLMAAGIALCAGQVQAQADDAGITRAHGYSYFGNLDYPADYDHLPYANPDAPKGGELSLGATGTFDSLNPYSRKGRAGALTAIQYDQLIESTADSVGQYYCVLCESLEYDEGKNYVIFNLRPEAVFSDGSPVTAEDVVYSHRLFIEQGLPSYAQAVGRMVTGAEALDEHTVKFTFAEGITRRSLIETVGNTPAFSKAWFEADPKRRLDEPRLEVAIGSGPYILDSYEVNRRIVYKRNPDYWGKDLPFNKGRHNYDTIRIEYFADSTAAFEAFKAGEYTFKNEGDPKQWATGYNFPRVQNGTVVKEALPDGSPPDAAGFVFNLAKPQFADKDVRKALALAFNFEWANESLRYGLYSQRSSFVEGTPLEAKATPQGAEKAFLDSLGDVVPDALMNEEPMISHSSDAGRLNDRGNLRRAAAILEDAGWSIADDNLRRNADGKTLDMRIPIPSNMDPTLEAMVETYVQNLKILGVNASYEKIDPAQYTLRRRERDYDVIYSTQYGAFLSTGGGLSQMYGSREAEFSLFNPAGIASPLVDAIIEASFDTTNQADQDAALMALDRALRFEYFVVPTGYIAEHWVAYFDMYEHPDPLPPYDLGYLDLWWIDAEKAQALKDKGALR